MARKVLWMVVMVKKFDLPLTGVIMMVMMIVVMVKFVITMVVVLVPLNILRKKKEKKRMTNILLSGLITVLKWENVCFEDA